MKNNHAEPGLARKSQLQSPEANLINRDVGIPRPHWHHHMSPMEHIEAKEIHDAMGLVTEIQKPTLTRQEDKRSKI